MRQSSAGPLVGVFAAPAYVDVELHLSRGDALLMYTDGVTDAGRPREIFGEERLAEVLTRARDDSAGVLLKKIETTARGSKTGRSR